MTPAQMAVDASSTDVSDGAVAAARRAILAAVCSQASQLSDDASAGGGIMPSSRLAGLSSKFAARQNPLNRLVALFSGAHALDNTPLAPQNGLPRCSGSKLAGHPTPCSFPAQVLHTSLLRLDCASPDMIQRLLKAYSTAALMQGASAKHSLELLDQTVQDMHSGLRSSRLLADMVKGSCQADAADADGDDEKDDAPETAQEVVQRALRDIMGSSEGVLKLLLATQLHLPLPSKQSSSCTGTPSAVHQDSTWLLDQLLYPPARLCSCLQCAAGPRSTARQENLGLQASSTNCLLQAWMRAPSPRHAMAAPAATDAGAHISLGDGCSTGPVSGSMGGQGQQAAPCGACSVPCSGGEAEAGLGGQVQLLVELLSLKLLLPRLPGWLPCPAVRVGCEGLDRVGCEGLETAPAGSSKPCAAKPEPESSLLCPATQLRQGLKRPQCCAAGTCSRPDNPQQSPPHTSWPGGEGGAPEHSARPAKRARAGCTGTDDESVDTGPQQCAAAAILLLRLLQHDARLWRCTSPAWVSLILGDRDSAECQGDPGSSSTSLHSSMDLQGRGDGKADQHDVLAKGQPAVQQQAAWQQALYSCFVDLCLCMASHSRETEQATGQGCNDAGQGVPAPCGPHCCLRAGWAEYGLHELQIWVGDASGCLLALGSDPTEALLERLQQCT